MKKIVFTLALLLGTSSAFAASQDVRVCSVGRTGQVYSTEFQVRGATVTMNVDGEILKYSVDSVRGADLKRASAIAGEKVVQSTQYVISSPQGTTTLQIAKGVSGIDYMLFPLNGIMGADSASCN